MAMDLGQEEVFRGPKSSESIPATGGAIGRQCLWGSAEMLLLRGPGASSFSRVSSTHLNVCWTPWSEYTPS